MNENGLSKIIIDAAFQVHTKAGPGLLESAYEAILTHELKKRGLRVARHVPVPIIYDDLVLGEGFRADLIVNELVIIELKSVEHVLPVHSKQVLTYLRLTNRKLGLLINFGESLIKNGIKRIVNGLPDEAAPMF